MFSVTLVPFKYCFKNSHFMYALLKHQQQLQPPLCTISCISYTAYNTFMFTETRFVWFNWPLCDHALQGAQKYKIHKKYNFSPFLKKKNNNSTSECNASLDKLSSQAWLPKHKIIIGIFFFFFCEFLTSYGSDI